MNKEFLRSCFNLILEKCNGDNSSDRDIIDFANGQSIDKSFIENEYEKYIDLQNKIDDFIEENDLDDTSSNDIKFVEENIPESKNYLRYNQACLIDFKDYIIKIVEDKLDSVRTAKMIFSKNGNGFLTTKIAIPVPWTKKMNLTEDNRECLLEFKDNNTIIIKKLKND